MLDENFNPPQPELPELDAAASNLNEAPADPPKPIESPGDLQDFAGEPFIEAGAPVEPAPHDPLVAAEPVEAQPLAATAAEPAASLPGVGQRLLFELWTLIVAAVGWFLPGGGYLIQKRWSRAIVGFLAVAAFALIGFKLRGNVFPPHGTEPFDYLGYVADLGSGFFYFIAKTVEAAGPDVSHASGDYGTRLVATAGVLNVLLILDAIQIARGEKS